jgi:uncharacterized membrane protein
VTTLRRVWLVSALYALVMFALGADRYATYRSGSDLGLFTQSIATVFHGFSNTVEGGSHFTYHFSPIFYLCAPFLLLVRSALALTAIQAVAGALALPPIYLIARKRLPERMATLCFAVAALYPPLVGVTFTDFHENGFAPAATLWLLWAVDARKFVLAAAFLAVTLGIKEDQSVILAFAGLVSCAYFLRAGDRGRALFSAAAAALSVATFVFFFEEVRALAGAHDIWAPTHFYTWSRIVDPRGSAPWYSIGRPAYFLEAVVPLALVCFASPAVVLALPGFAEVLGSHESITYTMGTHYEAVWVPYVLFAFVLGLATTYASRPRLARGLLRTSLVLCTLVLVFASPTHWGHYLGLRTAHDAVLDTAVAKIGNDLEVGTFDEVYAHAGFDPQAELGLRHAPRYALIDRTYSRSWFTVRYGPLLQRGVAEGRYRLIWSDDGVELYDLGGTSAGHAESGPRERGRRGVVARTSARSRGTLDRGRRRE